MTLNFKYEVLWLKTLVMPLHPSPLKLLWLLLSTTLKIHFYKVISHKINFQSKQSWISLICKCLHFGSKKFSRVILKIFIQLCKKGCLLVLSIKNEFQSSPHELSKTQFHSHERERERVTKFYYELCNDSWI